jgi:transcription initiation factor TFIIH subunit 4
MLGYGRIAGCKSENTRVKRIELTRSSEKDQAIQLLQQLHILQIVTPAGKPRAYTLTIPFIGSLRQALTGGGDHKSFGVPCSTPDKHQVTVAELDEYARRQWEAVLGFMVGSAGVLYNDGTEVSEGVKSLLVGGRLVSVRGKRAEITKEGFAFILQEVNAQVWTLLVYYLEAADQMNMDAVAVLSFLFTLGSLELGQDYTKSTLNPTQIQMLEDLSDYGLIYQTSRSSSRFYPTRLATTLTSDASALREATASFDTALRTSEGKGFVVIETNYRLYAYTTSPLQIAILQLFSKLNTRYPNMVAGKITRESIRRAVAMGITADQIISFLNTHAHPQMRKNNPILPPTVVDQIRLWQIEGERMKSTPGFLFKEFATMASYEGCCKYAEEVGVLVWKNDNKRMFFVTRHEQIAAYLKSRPGKA